MTESEHTELLDTYKQRRSSMNKAEMQMWLNKSILNAQRLEFNCSKDHNCNESGRSHANQY